jgi:DNA-binding FrmR family transcriptional regulator
MGVWHINPRKRRLTGGEMAEETVSHDVLIKRLKRIEGQVRGIEKMIESGRDCESVITQLTAVRSAIEGVGSLVLNNYMKLCFRETDQADSDGLCSLARAIGIWGRVHVGDSGR